MGRIPILTASVVLMMLPALRAETQAPIDRRFSGNGSQDVPQFRRHVVPLLAVLGCDKAGCHGSFGGRGGMQLSLFGYDPSIDYANLTDKENPRVDTEFTTDSLMLEKPTLHLPHGGGKRLEVGSWQYRVLLRWIEGGAKPVPRNHPALTRLDVTPKEIVFRKKGDVRKLRAVAYWADGSAEDVTPLCRYNVNNSQIANVDAAGKLTAVGAGDTNVVVTYDMAIVAVPVMRPVSRLIGERYPRVPTPTAVDKLVVRKLRKLGIVPSELSTDAEFLRRVELDLTGSLPTPREVTAFLSDESPGKRARKIDELLESSAYAAWWTTRLCDITGNNSDALSNVTPARGQASQEWYDWIYKRVKDNTPYDKLVAGIVLGTSREPGESYAAYCKAMSDFSRANGVRGRGRTGAKTAIGHDGFADRESMPYYWARRTFRKPTDRAVGFAYSFLGIHIQCAQCHKHPFDQWTQSDFKQFAGFFSNIRFGTNPAARSTYNSMMVDLGLKGQRGGDLRRALPRLLRDGKTVPYKEVFAFKVRPLPKSRGRKRRRRRRGPGARRAKLLAGADVDLTQYDDARQPLMEWLHGAGKERFARAFVNRVWAAYFNRGIVEPTDDLSQANPPCNKPLLDYLTTGFIQHGYNMKWLHRQIAGSRTYQLSWKPTETNRRDQRNFSHAIPRRLPAEVAYDALAQATASDTEIEKMHRDVSGRAIAIPGAGRRNVRNRQAAFGLSVFGRSTRDKNCDCDRSSDTTLLQTIYLQNDRDVLTMVDRRQGSWLAEVAAKTGLRYQPAIRPLNKGRSRKRPANYNRTVRKLTARLKALRKAGKRKAAVKVQRQLANYTKRFGRAANPRRSSSVGNAGSGTHLAAATRNQIVRGTYLRTLSRYPTDEELARARKYIDDDTDPINGVRGLLWALLNTKEFIVNH